MTVDVLSSEDPQDRPSFPGGGRAGGGLPSGARATALTTAVSLVLIGGVVTAAVRGSQHGASPESLVPASAFGYAQVDLGLADGQSSALSSFLAHFPDAPTKKGAGSLRDRVLGAMFRDSSRPHVDYAKDVKPWLGDHAAVAGWIDASGRPQLEFLLRSTDDGAARSSLHRLAPKMGVAFSNGYAVVAKTPQLASAAVAAAHKSSLSGDAHFHSDVAALGGPQVMTGWIDGARASKALLKEMHGLNPFSSMPGMSMPGLGVGGFGMSGLAAKNLNDRVAIGLHVTKTYAELVARSFGTSTTAGALAPSTMLTHLPDATIGAAEIASPGRLVTAAWGFASMFFGMRSSLSAGAFGSGSSSAPAFIGGSPYSSTVTVCPVGATCRPMPRRYAPYQPGRSQLKSNAQPARQTDPVAAIEKATGLKLPGDAVTLLGSAAVAAYGGLHGQGLPNIAVVTKPADVAAARALAEHSRDVVAQTSGTTLAVGSTASNLVMATNATYESAVEAGGHLGEQARFAAAMGSLPDEVGFALFVDLADVMPLIGHGQRDLDHLDAIGIWAGRDRMQMRLVVR